MASLFCIGMLFNGDSDGFNSNDWLGQAKLHCLIYRMEQRHEYVAQDYPIPYRIIDISYPSDAYPADNPLYPTSDRIFLGGYSKAILQSVSATIVFIYPLSEGLTAKLAEDKPPLTTTGLLSIT